MSPAASESKCTRPTEILVLGLSRTGTSSIKLALEKLGHVGVYHMGSSRAIFPITQKRKRLPPLKQKHEANGQQPVTREQFDEILGGYSISSSYHTTQGACIYISQALTDLPAIYFASEIITASPPPKQYSPHALPPHGTHLCSPQSTNRKPVLSSQCLQQ